MMPRNKACIDGCEFIHCRRCDGHIFDCAPAPGRICEDCRLDDISEISAGVMRRAEEAGLDPYAVLDQVPWGRE